MGFNVYKNSPSLPGIPLRSCSIHAEAAALRGVDAAGGTLYVARVTRRNTWGMARPCAGCEKLLREAQVRRVVWTASDDEYGVMVVR
jgi:pyrimidine deaminase RibD-like protein